MNNQLKKLVLVSIITVFASGCATPSNRVSSSVYEAEIAVDAYTGEVTITEDVIEAGSYEVVGPLTVTLKKLTAFHPNPTKEQVDEALAEKARLLGADTVMGVKYKSGVGFLTWNYMKATGTAVKKGK